MSRETDAPTFILTRAVASYLAAMTIHRSNMIAHVLLNLLNEFMKKDKIRGFFATSLINSIVH